MKLSHAIIYIALLTGRYAPLVYASTSVNEIYQFDKSTMIKQKLKKAQESLNNGDYSGAKNYLNGVLRLEPDNAKAKELMAACNNGGGVATSSKSNRKESSGSALSVSKTELSFGSNGGIESLTVSTGSSWSISVYPASWGYLTRSGDILTLKVDANPNRESRNDYFIIKSKSESLRVNISQAGKKLVDEQKNVQSMICIYEGGYFIRNGKKWYEYRPKDKPYAVWAEYSQYNEEDYFYNIKNTSNTVSIPKNSSNKVYIYKNTKWEVIYNTTQVFNICPQRGNKLFCHTRGFFFKNGNSWTEYLPDRNATSAWATYTQTSSDSNFYYIKNANDEVAIPRKPVNKFFVRKTSEDKWKEVYTTTQIFDY